MEEYGRAKQATDDNMAHALCLLHNYGRRHTLRICNTYCFCTATTVTLTRLNVTFIRTLLVVSFTVTVVICLRAERRLPSLDGNAHHNNIY